MSVRRLAVLLAGTTLALSAGPLAGVAAAAPTLAVNGLTPANGAVVQPPETVRACFTGTLIALSTITVTSDSLPVAGTSGLTSCGGTNNGIAFTPAADLAEGTYNVSATARDSLMDPASSTTVTWSFDVDTTDPATPSGLTVTNPVNSNNVANVTVSGTTSPNTDVSVSIANSPTPAGTATGTGTSNGAGAFTISGIDATALGQGALLATVTATDEAGNDSAATVASFKDTVAPSRASTVPAHQGTSQTRDTVVVTFTEAVNTTATTIEVFNGVGSNLGGSRAFSAGNTVLTFTGSSNFTPAGGVYSVFVNATDVAGNAAPQSVTTFTIDNTAPVAPSAVTLTDPVNAANVATAVVSGTAEPGSTVNVSVDDAVPGSPVTGSGPSHATTGAYAVTVDLTPLADGPVTATATATDGAGNTGPSTSSAASTKDTVAPAPPSVELESPVTNAGQTSVDVSGVAEPGSTVNISVDDATAGSPVTKSVSSDETTGAYATTVDLTPLSDGTVTASVTATDAAGNTGPAGTDTATKDTGLPGLPTLSMPTVNDANKSAVNATGVAEPGSTVEVVVSGSQVLSGTDTADGTTGAYSVPFDLSGLSDTTLTVTAVATDAAGNDSPTKTINVAKDTDVPNAPAVTMPAYVNDATKGAIELSGTAEAASTINLTISDTDGGTPHVTTSVVTAPNGTWTKTVDLSSLTDGTLTASATATDAAGNVSSAGTDTAVKDVVKPAAPAVSLTNPITPANVATSAVSGTAEADSTVNVSVNDTDGATSPVTGSGTATGGSYSVPVDLSSLSDGSLTATATATDAAGNVSDAGTSTASAKDTIALDVVSVTPVHGSVVQPPATITFVLNEPVDTAQTSIVLADTTAGTLAGTTTFTNGNKTVVFTPSGTLSDAGSPYTATLTAKDADGTDTDTGTSTFTVDGTAPATPTVSIPEVVNAANDQAVTVSGVAEPGSTVTVSVDDATVGSPVTDTETADGTTGAYSTTLDLSSLADGALTASATATDVAGNTSSAGTDTATKDATVPAMPTVNLPQYVNNAGKAAVPVSGVAEPGSDVVVTIDDATPGDAVVKALEADATTGAYSTTADLTALADGTVTASAVATDAAGNPSAAGTDTAVKDTVAPGTPTVALSEPINAANKTTVTVSGIAEPGSSVTVFVDDATVGDALMQNVTADGTTGEYSRTFDVTSLADGTLTASVALLDAAGNQSPVGTDTATKDSGIPDAPTIAAMAPVTRQTYTAAPFSGTAEAGTTVTVTVNDTDGTTAPVTGTTTANGEGAWSKSLDLSSLKDSTLAVSATATDSSGNPSAAATGAVVKNVTRAFVIAVSTTPVSGAAQAFTVTAKQTYDPLSSTDTTYTGTPVLSSGDTHFTAGTCSAAVAGVSDCTGTVFGDLGPQTLTAAQGTGDDLVTAAQQVTVQATGLVFSAAPPATATVNQALSFTTVPTAGVEGALISGYDAVRTLVTTGGSTPETGTALTCDAASCQSSVSFFSRGPKTVKVVDNGTPSRSTATADVVVPYAVDLALFRTKSTVPSGSYVTIFGDVFNTTTLEGVPGATVKIYRKTAPNTTFKLYTTVVTDEDGIWAKRMLVQRNTSYKTVYAGDAQHLPGTSLVVSVKASQVVTVTWTTTGRTVKATGRVTPNAAGRTIYLQVRRADGTWAYAGAKAVVRSTGTYTLSRTLAPGRYVLRAAIAATSVNTGGYSSLLSTRIT